MEAGFVRACNGHGRAIKCWRGWPWLQAMGEEDRQECLSYVDEKRKSGQDCGLHGVSGVCYGFNQVLGD